MSMHPSEHTEQECLALLLMLAPDIKAVMHTVAPSGWASSRLSQVAHPTPEQRLKAARRQYEASSLFKAAGLPDREPPTLDDFTDADETPVRPLDELRYILGSCLWDIFSNNNEVVDAKGTVYHLGSFRGSGRFIAEFLNRHHAIEDGTTFDYIDFYMGSFVLPEPDILSPVYIYLFERLRAAGGDWTCDAKSRMAPSSEYADIDSAYTTVFGRAPHGASLLPS